MIKRYRGWVVIVVHKKSDNSTKDLGVVLDAEGTSDLPEVDDAEVADIDQAALADADRLEEAKKRIRSRVSDEHQHHFVRLNENTLTLPQRLAMGRNQFFANKFALDPSSH